MTANQILVICIMRHQKRMMAVSKQWDKLWIHGLVAKCDQGYGLIENGAVAVKAGIIVWVGPMDDLPDDPYDLANEVFDISGKCLTPGLIDCHTHLVYGGNRAYEFELRLEGATYEEIARQGGGIQSTVSQTRGLSEDELFQQSIKRARALLASGATTIEIKSGYGLDLACELKILTVAKRIAAELPITVQKTFLGAHTVPHEFKDRADAYIDLVCHDMLPAVAENQLADAVDVFCENIGFDLAQTERVFKTATELGLRVKCHAEQLSDSGAAKLAAKYHALSVDHLEHLSEEGVKAIAESKTVAVLLPGAFYFLREKQLPPIDLLRKHNVPIAIASDCNPGTSPILSLQLIIHLACTLFRMTPEEALLGVTLHAAKALGLDANCGSIEVDKRADLLVWNVQYPAEMAYFMGGDLVDQIICKGDVFKIDK